MFWWHSFSSFLRFFLCFLLLYFTSHLVQGASVSIVLHVPEMLYMQVVRAIESDTWEEEGKACGQCFEFNKNNNVNRFKVSEIGMGGYLIASGSEKTFKNKPADNPKSKYLKNTTNNKKVGRSSVSGSEKTNGSKKREKVTKKKNKKNSVNEKNTRVVSKFPKQPLTSRKKKRFTGATAKKEKVGRKSEGVLNKVTKKTSGREKVVSGQDKMTKTRLANKKKNRVAAQKTKKKGLDSTKGNLKEAIKFKTDDERSRHVLSVACSFMGAPYVYGGNSKLGIDCSGLVCSSYREIGLDLPRVTSQMIKHGSLVSMGSLKPGDLVFFGANPGSKKVVHVGIVVGEREGGTSFIHASSSSGVTESSLHNPYHASRFLFAKRVIET